MLCAATWRWVGWVVGAGLLFAPDKGLGQVAGGPVSAQAVLLEMAARAGVIFTGEVVGVTRSDASGSIEVRFRVQEAVKGVGRGRAAAYVLREWAGLWTGGDRYRVGQRYLMLLTTPGASGLSAPVDGMDGAIPLVAGESEPLARGGGDVSAEVAGQAEMRPELRPEMRPEMRPETRVDVRWLTARAVRATGVRGMTAYGGGAWVGENAAQASFVPVEKALPDKRWLGAVSPLLESGSAGMTVSSVVALLRVSGGDVHVAR